MYISLLFNISSIHLVFFSVGLLYYLLFQCPTLQSTRINKVPFTQQIIWFSFNKGLVVWLCSCFEQSNWNGYIFCERPSSMLCFCAWLLWLWLWRTCELQKTHGVWNINTDIHAYRTPPAFFSFQTVFNIRNSFSLSRYHLSFLKPRHSPTLLYFNFELRSTVITFYPLCLMRKITWLFSRMYIFPPHQFVSPLAHQFLNTFYPWDYAALAPSFLENLQYIQNTIRRHNSRGTLPLHVRGLFKLFLHSVGFIYSGVRSSCSALA